MMSRRMHCGRWLSATRLAVLTVAVAACSTSAPSPREGASTATASAAEAALVSDLAAHYGEAEAGQILFWNDEQRRVGFKHIRGIMPTRRVVASGDPYPLADRPTDFSALRYDVDGRTYDLDHFLDLDASIGVIVVSDDEILLEDYAPGNDVDSVWISFSVTKSITSMLIGAAIAEGYIASVDEPVTTYLPRLRGSGYDGASIADVLHMASGVAWNEDYADPDSDVARAGGANGIELFRYLGELPRNAPAGEVFNYNTGETNLVGAILRAALGNNAADYLERRIWQPFGMANDAYWSVSPRNNTELGGCCLNATLRDYARLGLFALHDGVLPDGTRVLPEGWMAQSTAPSAGSSGYGYLWWLTGDGSYSARGIFGQAIVVDPARNLVIAMHSNAPQATGSDYAKHMNAVIDALRSHLAR